MDDDEYERRMEELDASWVQMEAMKQAAEHQRKQQRRAQLQQSSQPPATQLSQQQRQVVTQSMAKGNKQMRLSSVQFDPQHRQQQQQDNVCAAAVEGVNHKQQPVLEQQRQIHPEPQQQVQRISAAQSLQPQMSTVDQQPTKVAAKLVQQQVRGRAGGVFHNGPADEPSSSPRRRQPQLQQVAQPFVIQKSQQQAPASQVLSTVSRPSVAADQHTFRAAADESQQVLLTTAADLACPDEIVSPPSLAERQRMVKRVRDYDYAEVVTLDTFLQPQFCTKQFQEQWERREIGPDDLVDMMHGRQPGATLEPVSYVSPSSMIKPYVPDSEASSAQHDSHAVMMTCGEAVSASSAQRGVRKDTTCKRRAAKPAPSNTRVNS